MKNSKFAKFKGGKSFNFEFAPTTYDTTSPKLFNYVQIELPSSFFRINPSSKTKISAFSSVCEVVSFNFKTNLILPYDTEIIHTNSVNSLKLKITSELKQFPSSTDLFSRWSKTDIWMGAKNLITQGFINPFADFKRIFIEIGNTQPFLYTPQDQKIENLTNISELISEVFNRKIPITFTVLETLPQIYKQLKSLKGNIDVFKIKAKYPSPSANILLTNKVYPLNASKNSDKYIVFNYSTLIRFLNLMEKGEYSPVYTVIPQNTENHKYSSFYPWTLLPDIFNSIKQNDDDTANKIKDSDNTRIIRNGFLTGEEILIQNLSQYSLRPQDTGINIIHNPKSRTFLHFLRPAFLQDSVSPLVAGSLLPKTHKKLDSGLRGERRNCLNCSMCEDICPMKLNPQLLYKYIKADLTDDAINIGLLRCSECGLCSYVCPAKLEITDTLKEKRFKIFEKIQQQ